MLVSSPLMSRAPGRVAAQVALARIHEIEDRIAWRTGPAAIDSCLEVLRSALDVRVPRAILDFAIPRRRPRLADAAGASAEEAALHGAHRGLLVRFRVIPAADVQRSMDHEKAQLVGR